MQLKVLTVESEKIESLLVKNWQQSWIVTVYAQSLFSFWIENAEEFKCDCSLNLVMWIFPMHLNLLLILIGIHGMQRIQKAGNILELILLKLSKNPSGLKCIRRFKSFCKQNLLWIIFIELVRRSKLISQW